MHFNVHLILNNNNISLSNSLPELIQNADDNSYPDSLGEGECPSVQFIMQPEGVVVLNNETGFADKNIRALCDVGRSTKGKHKAGYIGTLVLQFIHLYTCTKRCLKNLILFSIWQHNLILCAE